MFYQGEALQEVVDAFLQMVVNGATVHEYPGAILVLEDYLWPGVVRAWLLFDRFSKATVSAIRSVTEQFEGVGIVAETHDPRIRDLLLRLGYEQVYQDEHDFYLIHKGVKHGL